MLVVHTIADLRNLLDRHRAEGRTIGFAPTMGALHEGHASLLRAAADRHDIGVGSIFVNPLQFAAGEDLDEYPRRPEADRRIVESAGIDVLFTPSVAEMYPEPIATEVRVSGITSSWEGESRPTHFAGVTTVVTKLFNSVGACTAYFGEKDFQQLATIRRMARDLDQPVDVVGLPTIREPDGLAMSSRNLRLLPEHRREASIVHRSLRAGADSIEGGETDPAIVESVVRSELSQARYADAPDYVAVVDAVSLEVPATLSGEVRLLTAVRFGDVRLIDNVGVTVP